jgi:2-deoxy-D-gluconate 3-dehydrogenase
MNSPMNDAILARTPANRWGQPDELAGAAVFLASRAADFITGTLVTVDGGYSIC